MKNRLTLDEKIKLLKNYITMQSNTDLLFIKNPFNTKWEQISRMGLIRLWFAINETILIGSEADNIIEFLEANKFVIFTTATIQTCCNYQIIEEKDYDTFVLDWLKELFPNKDDLNNICWFFNKVVHNELPNRYRKFLYLWDLNGGSGKSKFFETIAKLVPTTTINLDAEFDKPALATSVFAYHSDETIEKDRYITANVKKLVGDAVCDTNIKHAAQFDRKNITWIGLCANATLQLKEVEIPNMISKVIPIKMRGKYTGIIGIEQAFDLNTLYSIFWNYKGDLVIRQDLINELVMHNSTICKWKKSSYYGADTGIYDNYLSYCQASHLTPLGMNNFEQMKEELLCLIK